MRLNVHGCLSDHPGKQSFVPVFDGDLHLKRAGGRIGCDGLSCHPPHERLRWVGVHPDVRTVLPPDLPNVAVGYADLHLYLLDVHQDQRGRTRRDQFPLLNEPEGDPARKRRLDFQMCEVVLGDDKIRLGLLERGCGVLKLL